MFIFSIVFSIVSGLILKLVATILKFETNSFKSCFFSMFISTFFIYLLLMTGLLNNPIVAYVLKLIVVWGVLSITLQAPKVKGLIVAAIFAFAFSATSTVTLSKPDSNSVITQQRS